jgi:hypothetical protein
LLQTAPELPHPLGQSGRVQPHHARKQVREERFQIHGSRPNTSTDMEVTQRIFNDQGGYSDRPTTAQMYFAGDGHTHWYVRDLETYELLRLDNGSKVGTGAKHGFCFFDNEHFGSTEAAGYLDCGNNPNSQYRRGSSLGGSYLTLALIKVFSQACYLPLL